MKSRKYTFDSIFDLINIEKSETKLGARNGKTVATGGESAVQSARDRDRWRIQDDAAAQEEEICCTCNECNSILFACSLILIF